MRVKNLLTGCWCEPVWNETTQSWGVPHEEVVLVNFGDISSADITELPQN